MKRPKLSEMTLREKIGQTGFPSPRAVSKGVLEFGSYAEYFKAYPYCGHYIDQWMIDEKGEILTSPEEVGKILTDTSNELKIPLFVSCDFEHGAKAMSPKFHRIPTNMSLGAANSKDLTFKRAYYFAKEVKTMGVNWPFGPVGDLVQNFFAQSPRRLGEDTTVVENVFPELVRGMQAVGSAACAKHFPGGSTDYRDSHFCSANDRSTREEWNKKYMGVWKSAIDAGVMSFMVGHQSVPALDDSYARSKVRRPASASKKVIDVLRNDLGFDGVVVTDAVGMKGLSAAFGNSAEIYIECFNAGNDVILFVRDDYIDVMEKAIADGRISMEQLDRSVERILDMKEKIGLFDGEIKPGEALTEEENKLFDEVNYNIAKSALTLIANEDNAVPFNPEKVKRATIVKLSPSPEFANDLTAMKEAFEARGVHADIVDFIKTKEQLQELSETEDIIVYACAPGRMNFYNSREDLSTLFHSLSHGAEKTVVASFASPSVYYNYFENANIYINAYSSDAGTMSAFVDGILGDFEFTGKSPVRLAPIPIKR